MDSRQQRRAAALAAGRGRARSLGRGHPPASHPAMGIPAFISSAKIQPSSAARAMSWPISEDCAMRPSAPAFVEGADEPVVACQDAAIALDGELAYIVLQDEEGSNARPRRCRRRRNFHWR